MIKSRTHARGRLEHIKHRVARGREGKYKLWRYDAQVHALGTYKSVFHDLWGLMWGRTNLIYVILLFLLYYFRLHGGATGRVRHLILNDFTQIKPFSFNWLRQLMLECVISRKFTVVPSGVPEEYLKNFFGGLRGCETIRTF